MKFYIEGMKCAKCVAKVEGLAQKIESVDHITVDLGQNVAVVEVNDPAKGFFALADSIQNLGFRISAIPWSEMGQEEWKIEARKDVLRLGVAAFFAANIMMLAFATYLGDTENLEPVFLWLQFFLYLPVVSYVAYPFYDGFWQGLKNRQFTIDGPMAIASLSGFLVSTYNLLVGRENIYFDSLSGFLFLILVTRYWQKQTRHQYLKYLRPSALFESLRSRLLSGQSDQWNWVSTESLKKDQQVLVEKGELLPGDGILASASAIFDLSILNGEERPIEVVCGSSVKAGFRLISDSAVIKIQEVGLKTTLGQILNSIQTDSLSRLESIRSADKASHWLILIVFSLAFLLSGYGFLIGQFSEYFERAFALIILACPCAMAFGTPLVFSLAMKKASDLGLIVKSITFFERLTQVQSVFLDKTEP